MKKSIVYLLLTAVLFLPGMTGLYAAESSDDIKDTPSCKYCGMDREKFSHSRMVIQYDDGSKTGTCSLHCSAVDLVLSLDKNPKTIMVGDYKTKKLINAEEATWVIGGKAPGVMSKNAKWAFASREDAEAFQKDNGGALANFDQALDTAYKDIGNDTKMIREKRKMKKMKMPEQMHQH